MKAIREPNKDCNLCPRLADFRNRNRKTYPHFHNAPVPSYSSSDGPSLLIVGLAPGLKGANCTGRPFTNDFAGDLLYATLLAFGFAEGVYERRADDGLQLKNCRITNAVKCVPPENKPTPEEIKTCNSFLTAEMKNLPQVKAIVALGQIAHGAVLKALGLRPSAYKFSHGAVHPLDNQRVMFNSYHCSRYNVNTGRLTEKMFHDVFTQVAQYLKEDELKIAV